MKMILVFIGVAMLVSAIASSFADDSKLNIDALGDDQILIRPQAGLGLLDDDKSYHVGLRLLFKASAEKKYGMELTRLFTSGAEYIGAGIVLERKKYRSLNLSIGTIGYFGQSSGTKNLPGLLLNIGWEPDTANAIKPFLTLRNEVIFADKSLYGRSISAGFSVIF